MCKTRAAQLRRCQGKEPKQYAAIPANDACSELPNVQGTVAVADQVNVGAVGMGHALSVRASTETFGRT